MDEQRKTIAALEVALATGAMPEIDARLTLKVGGKALEPGEPVPATLFSGMRIAMARLLMYIAEGHDGAGDLGEALGVYDDLVVRFAGDPSPGLERLVSKALRLKGNALASSGRVDAAHLAFDEAIDRYSEATSVGTRFQVAKALDEKARLLQKPDPERADRIRDRLIEDYGDDDNGSIQDIVALAEIGMASRHLQADRFDLALALTERALTRTGSRDTSRSVRALALLTKTAALIGLGHGKEAVKVYRETTRDYADQTRVLDTSVAKKVARLLTASDISLADLNNLREDRLAQRRTSR